MNPLYESFPETVFADGKEYCIITSFHDWVKFVDMVQDEALTPSEKMLLAMQYYVDEIPADTGTAADILIDFFVMKGCGENWEIQAREKLKEPPIRKIPLFDFCYDAGCIIAGFQQAYGINLTEADMHWWRFRILLNGLPENTEFKQRIYYRGINVGEIKDIKEKQRILKIQHQIALPAPPLSDEEIGGMFW